MTEAVLADLESRARAAIQTGDWAGAVAAFDAVARHQPGDRRTWGNLARAWVLAGDPTAAGLAFRRVLILDPAAFDALELSVSLAEGGHGRGGFDDVRWSWLACADPLRPLALKVMAARLQKRGATLAARDLFARAAHADPGDIDAKVNQALAEIELGNRDAAESALQEALDRDPQESRARYARGWIKLARGDWSGYEDYDARWRQPDADARSRLIPAPLWEGGVVSGGRLVLTDQFGVGDAILFAGLASEAARRAQATTVLEADPRLVPLFARSFPDVRVVARSDPPVPDMVNGVAAQCAIPRLPVLLGPGTPGFDPPAPFLVPDPDRVAYWREKLARMGPGPYTGIAWRSGNHRTAGRKSIPLPSLAPLLDALDGTAISLQYDPDPEEIAAARASGLPTPLANPAPDLRNALDDLAAQIAAYDRIVSIAGVVAHLAGALGVPGLILMQRDPLWYWFIEGETVPWYPSLTILRQTKPDWGDVVADAARRVARDGVH